MAQHIHPGCGHSCNCGSPADRCCAADVVLLLSVGASSMTAQNLQDILDTKYGQPASQPLVGPTDCAS